MTLFLKMIGAICISVLSLLTLHGQYFYLADYDGTGIQFEQKGDLNLSISYPIQNRSNLHLGYCPLKHISISGGFFKHRQSKQFHGLSDIRINGRSYSGAIGFYNFFKSPFNSKTFIFNQLQGFLLQSHFGYSNNKISNYIDDLIYTDLYSQNYFFQMEPPLKIQKTITELRDQIHCS